MLYYKTKKLILLLLIVILLTLICNKQTKHNIHTFYRKYIILQKDVLNISTLKPNHNHAEINKELCPVNNKSIIITVKPGGRLGNLVFEYLSVFAWSKEIPNSIPVIQDKMISKLNSIYENLTVESIETLDRKCKKYNFLQKYNFILPNGNWHIKTEIMKKINAPKLLVLPIYSTGKDILWKYWKDLYKEMRISCEFINKSNEKLHTIKETFINQYNLEENEILEFVGVHVRKTDYAFQIQLRFPEAKPAEATYYIKAIKKMRKLLNPKRAIFVVASDDMEWCKKHFQNISDVVLSAATGNIENPGEDISLLCSCNHTIMSYGTFGLASTICHPNGHVIVYKDERMPNSAVAYAKWLNWTMISN